MFFKKNKTQKSEDITNASIGKDAEIKAAAFLRKNALTIIEMNYHSRFGEIDIIAEDKSVLHFVEVKATSKDYDPLYRITEEKMAKIIKTVEYYLLKHNVEKEYQIDAILVYDNNLEWIKNILY